MSCDDGGCLATTTSESASGVSIEGVGVVGVVGVVVVVVVVVVVL